MSKEVTRRQFHRQIGLVSGALVVGVAAGQCRGEEAEAGPHKPACDFQSSFMTWDFPPTPDSRPYARHNCPLGNMARIQVDAIVDVIDDEAGQSDRFVLIAACRTEWVYAEDRLFQIPSREYRNIYSLTQQRPMACGITDDGATTHGHPVSDQFRSLEIDVKTFAQTRVQKTPAEINAAVAANLPLVARTTVRDPTRPMRYVLEYPIRTMNFRPENASFQVDTGPLLAPDFDSAEARAIDRLEMAHVAYNRLDRAEFIFRRPTPILDEDGAELCRVLQYSQVRECPATTLILSGEQ
ncbi:MAG: hypothetical protein HQ582_31300 [Planctomycetes bacterium]|nr:hypothetical protein [Planctomycetota bacterium]